MTSWRLNTFARLFFGIGNKEERMQSKVRPASKSSTTYPRRHMIKSRMSLQSFENGEEMSSPYSQTLASSSSTATASIMTSDKLCCDKCDGKHETSQCPYYKTNRGSHPDEQKNFYKKLGGVSSLPGQTLRSARVIRQPGDGSCLFHSMSYGEWMMKAIAFGGGSDDGC